MDVDILKPVFLQEDFESILIGDRQRSRRKPIHLNPRIIRMPIHDKNVAFDFIRKGFVSFQNGDAGGKVSRGAAIPLKYNGPVLPIRRNAFIEKVIPAHVPRQPGKKQHAHQRRNQEKQKEQSQQVYQCSEHDK